MMYGLPVRIAQSVRLTVLAQIFISTCLHPGLGFGRSSNWIVSERAYFMRTGFHLIHISIQYDRHARQRSNDE